MLCHGTSAFDRRPTLYGPRLAVLDDAFDALLFSRLTEVGEAFDTLVAALGAIRRSSTPDNWRRFRAVATLHPLTHLLHQDPLTRRCYYKPRGYAGDARTLDFVYGHVEEDDSTGLGRALLEAVVKRPLPCAMRRRLELVRDEIDETARRVRLPRILSVGCGHFREAGISRAIQDGRVGECVVLDQDEKSLATVQREYAGLRITPRKLRVRDLIGNMEQCDLGTFDLVYAAGLYDYIAQPGATQLTSKLFSLLRRDGRLIIWSFGPDSPDAGYMETYMAWHLTYRTVAELEAVSADLPEAEVAARHATQGEIENVSVLRIQRGGSVH